MKNDEKKKMMENIGTARDAILDDLKARFKTGDKNVKPSPNKFQTEYDDEPREQKNYFSGAGTMPCPVCKTGTLRYSRSSYNGHVHAACTTESCVRWME
jgi:hypothetical protein